jgi:hypothetical protein
MAGNDRKRQKKLERKNARRKEMKVIARQESGGLPAQLSQAAKYPILHCWMTNSNFDSGMGMVVISRQMPDGTVGFANFLVDPWCLGVKDVHVGLMHRTEYDEKIDRRMRADHPGRDVPPEDACKYVTGAVAYARELGFSPHPDYAKGMILFTGVDPAASKATFEYGYEGKPHYVSGPHEGMRRVRQVLAILENHCGKGGYNYTIPLDPSGGVMAIDDEDEGEDDGPWSA